MPAALPKHENQFIVQLLALGNTRKEIQDKFEERYGHPVHYTTISRIKQKNKAAVSDAHDVMVSNSPIVGAAALKQKAYKLLDKRMDQAIEDEDEVDVLRMQLRSGEITKDEFDRDMARLERLTIKELAIVADKMHDHTKHSDDEPELSAADQAALALLMQGMKQGNPFQLVQVLNPNIKMAPREAPVDVTPEPAQ